jgi:hypothetical protein
MQGQIFSSLKFHEQKAQMFWKEINPKDKSCYHLVKLLELLVVSENWEQIINLSSRAVLHLNDHGRRLDFYYIWLIALNESQDFSSLESLTQHMYKNVDSHSFYLALCSMGYSLLGNYQRALHCLKKQKQLKKTNNKFYKEALALFLTLNSSYSSDDKKNKMICRGLYLYKKLCSKEVKSYFIWRNCIRALSQNNYMNSLSRMYNLMHIYFPFASEPYFVSSLIAMNEEKWPEAIRYLNQLHRDCLSNTSVILALVDCYCFNEQEDQALKLIEEHKALFHEKDYDFNVSSALVFEKQALKIQSENYFVKASAAYDNAIEQAKLFQFPSEALAKSKKNMEVLFKNNNMLLPLNEFLTQNLQFKVSSLNLISYAGRGVQIGEK